MPKTIAVKVKKQAEKAIKQGHPWIFESSITKINKTPEAGDVAIVFDQKENQFLAIGLYDPASMIAIRILGLEKAKIDEAFFFSRFKLALEHRQSLLEYTNAYRLIYGEGDHMPGLIIDCYGPVAVMKLYSACWFPFMDMMIAALSEILEVDAIILRLARNVFSDVYEDGSVLFGYLEKEEIVIQEYGVLFQVNVIHGHKTGYFLDHRQNRRQVGEMSRGKSVLDVFSYSGGFTTHAAVGGASSVTSIDISSPAIALVEKNLQLNGYNGIYNGLVGDAFEILEQLLKDNHRYDIIVIDPPAFAKKSTEVDKALHSYGRLAVLGAQLVNQGGVLLMASCSSRVDSDLFFKTIEDQFIKSRNNMRLLNKTFHDIDHPITISEMAYLKCGYYQKN